MMIRSSHVIVSTAIVSTGVYLTNTVPYEGVPLLIGTVFGSQLPDIDHPNAEISRITGPIGRYFSGHGHRGMTHSLLALVPIILLWMLWPSSTQSGFGTKMFLAGVFLGYLLHLVEDNFSRQGVLWLWPMSHYEVSRAGHPYKKRKFHKWYYSTGSRYETIIRNVFLVFGIFMFYQVYRLWF